MKLIPERGSLGLSSLLFILITVTLHFVTFYVLAHLVPGAIFFTTMVLGFVLGALAWPMFHTRHGLKFWQVFWLVLLLIVITAPVLLVFGLETAICLVLGLPLFAPAALLGLLVSREVERRRDGGMGGGPKSRAVLLGLPLIVAGIEGQITYPLGNAGVTTRIEIAAPPAIVWANTLEIAPIRDDERIWTMSHHLLGAPQPVSAVLEGDRRTLRWTKGVRFAEIITERRENRHLVWRFAFDDPESLAAFDPHISPDSPRLRLTRGEYILEPTATGTRLTLQTHYLLRTPFNGYLKLWGERFLQDFHSSVLSVIKIRAEAQKG